MAREIKFRAKFCKPLRCAVLIPPHRKEGEWVIGDLHLFTRTPHIHEITFEKYPIDITTIGQFTGLQDINGREIYEGDIVTIGENGLKCIIDYHEFLGMFYLKWTDDRPQSINDDKSSIGRMQKLYDIEVIGNIYDNPELLK